MSGVHRRGGVGGGEGSDELAEEGTAVFEVVLPEGEVGGEEGQVSAVRV